MFLVSEVPLYLPHNEAQPARTLQEAQLSALPVRWSQGEAVSYERGTPVVALESKGHWRSQGCIAHKMPTPCGRTRRREGGKEVK